MPKYLFTSDQRISQLLPLIKKVATLINGGGSVSSITDKSENNNAATLKFYYNLQEGTEICNLAASDPNAAVRNFVLKFQFPNVRTPESFKDSLSEHALFAPFRTVVKTLYKMAEIAPDGSSYIGFDEILYYMFCNDKVYCNPSVDYDQLVTDIMNGRNAGIDLDPLVLGKLQWKQYGRQIGELMTVLSYSSDAFTISKRTIYFSLNSEGYKNDKEYIDSILQYKYIWFPSNPADFTLSTKEYTAFMDTKQTSFNVVDVSIPPKSKKVNKNTDKEYGYNKIFYGAPGTGKSHAIDEDYIKGSKSFRITFHPDTDYSSFVGCYKPTMGGPNNDQITYAFTSQTFIKAYIHAWNNREDKTFLVIEELNRGNCAQIFGDIFQLLDRRSADNPGFSRYYINVDSDIAEHLKKQINNVEYEKTIKEVYSLDSFDYSIMALPDNLYILATMNTSDQSLFPIDSAFKRRWEMQYIAVDYIDAAQFKLKIDEVEYSWAVVLKGLNEYIKSETQSTNKLIGNRFVQANENNEIDLTTFRDKVLFFLFNDVFKDNENFASMFYGEDSEYRFFEDLFVVTDKTYIINFINNICDNGTPVENGENN